MKTKYILGAIAVLLLTGCADKVSFVEAASHTAVGFWYGLWHGIISGWAFLISLFTDDVAVYAIYNNGGWYDFGFLWGVGMGCGVSYRISKR